MTRHLSALIWFVFLAVMPSQSLPAQQKYKWGTVFMGGGGFVSAIIAAPNDKDVFYARTDVGGAYRWDQTSSTWISLLDWVSTNERGLLGIDGIAVDPSVKGRVYMLAGTTYWNDGKSMFLRSEDYGATWDKIDVTNLFKAHGNGMGRGNGERLAVDPNNSDIIFCGTRFNGLWKSTDRGSTWKPVTSLPITTTASENGVNVVLFDKNSSQNNMSQIIYASVSQADKNLYISKDAGESWELIEGRPATAGIMPQRMVLTNDGRFLFVTYGNGAGPHAMLWNGVEDYYNRGAVYRFDTKENIWTDISPVNFMLDLDKIKNDEVHYGAYSGISIDPNNEARMVVTSINSYRGPQFWQIDGVWKDCWGDNIFVSDDSGKTWRDMFRYYWLDGGIEPDYKMIDHNGIPWIIGNTIHWTGCAVIDPFNPDRAFVTSGNGVFSTDSLYSFTSTTEWQNNKQVTKNQGRATWKFSAHGIEETVPEDLISIPGGPLISAIYDYDGFIHHDITSVPAKGRHMTTINGQQCALGSTTAIAFASKKPSILAKATAAEVDINNQKIEICAVTVSSDTGKTWTQLHAEATPVSQKPVKGALHKGKVALSADGEVIVWAPFSWQISPNNPNDTISTGHKEMFYYQNSSWGKCLGIEFSGRPLADPENSDKFYAYNSESGVVFVSIDKGKTFTPAGTAGTSRFKTARAAPGIEGDIWIPLTDSGLTRSTNSAESFRKIEKVTYCEAVGFGKAAPDKNYPAVYIFGTVDWITGVFRSDDEGDSWVHINDDAHEYGGLANGEFVMGDMNVYGRVYMSTAGRGIVYGEPEGLADTKEMILFKKNNRITLAAVSRNSLHINISNNEAINLSFYDMNGKLITRRVLKGSDTVSFKSIFKAFGVYTFMIKNSDGLVQHGRISYFR